MYKCINVYMYKCKMYKCFHRICVLLQRANNFVIV